MTHVDEIIERRAPIDLNNLYAVAAAATAMCAALQFDRRDCRRALQVCGGDLDAAAEYLADGGWLFGKVADWDWPSLADNCAHLVARTGMPENQCLETLQDCGGNAALAARKLAGLPVWP